MRRRAIPGNMQTVAGLRNQLTTTPLCILPVKQTRARRDPMYGNYDPKINKTFDFIERFLIISGAPQMAAATGLLLLTLPTSMWWIIK